MLDCILCMVCTARRLNKTWHCAQGPQAGDQGVQGLAEGAGQFPATPDRFSRAPHPASPEDQQSAGSAVQGFGGHSSQQGPMHAGPIMEEEPPLQGNTGVADIPNYPRENPLFDEESQQQEVTKKAEPEPVFHDNPAFDEASIGKPALGSPMIPTRGLNQASSQQGSFESSPQVAQPHGESERESESRFGGAQSAQHATHSTSYLDIPPEFDPNNPQDYTPSHPQSFSPPQEQLPQQQQHPSESFASGSGGAQPQFLEPEVQERSYGQPELHRQLSEPREIPHEENIPAAAFTSQPQVFDNSTFEEQQQQQQQPQQLQQQQFQQQEQGYGQQHREDGMHRQMEEDRQHPSEAVTAANAAVEQEVLIGSEPQAEVETGSNAAEVGHVHEQRAFEQPQGMTGVTGNIQVCL